MRPSTSRCAAASTASLLADTTQEVAIECFSLDRARANTSLLVRPFIARRARAGRHFNRHFLSAQDDIVGRFCRRHRFIYAHSRSNFDSLIMPMAYYMLRSISRQYTLMD